MTNNEARVAAHLYPEDGLKDNGHSRMNSKVVDLAPLLQPEPKPPGWLHALWSLVNYGGEVIPGSVERIGPWVHLSRCITVRRDPVTEVIVSEEPCIVVHLDALPPGIPAEIPPEAWQYAFEEPWGHFKITPQSTVHLVLESIAKGIILKAPITLLLLLAQDACPLAQLTPERITTLAQAWEPFFQAQRFVEWDMRASNVPHLGLSLFLRWDALSDLLNFVSSSRPHLLKQYVEEVWELLVGDESLSGGKPATSFAFAQSGDALRWFSLHVRDPETTALGKRWRASDRSKWDPRVGGTGTVDLRWHPALAPLSPPASWDVLHVKFYTSFTPVSLLQTNATLLPPRDMALPSLPISGECDTKRGVPGEVAGAFQTFYSGQFGAVLELREYHPGILVFQEVCRVTAAATPKPNARKSSVVVEVAAIPDATTACGNLLTAGSVFAFLKLLPGKGQVRWFIFSPGDACVELRPPPDSKVASTWGLSGQTHVLQATKLVQLFQSEAHGVTTDLCFCDLPALARRALEANPLAIALIGAWECDPATQSYSPFSREGKLTRAMQIVGQVYTPPATNPPAAQVSLSPAPLLLPPLYGSVSPPADPTVLFREVLAWKHATGRGVPGPSYLSSRELGYLQQLFPVAPTPDLGQQGQSSPINVEWNFAACPPLNVFVAFQKVVYRRDVELVFASENVAEVRLVDDAAREPQSPHGSPSGQPSPGLSPTSGAAPPSRALVFVTPPLPTFHIHNPSAAAIPLPGLLRFLWDFGKDCEVYIIHALDQVLEQTTAAALLAELVAYRPNLREMLPGGRPEGKSKDSPAEETGEAPEGNPDEGTKAKLADEVPGEEPKEELNETKPESILPPLFFGYDFSSIAGLWRYDASLARFDPLPVVEPPWDNYLALFAHLEQSAYRSNVQVWDEGQRAWIPISSLFAGETREETPGEEKPRENEISQENLEKTPEIDSDEKPEEVLDKSPEEEINESPSNETLTEDGEEGSEEQSKTLAKEPPDEESGHAVEEELPVDIPATTFKEKPQEDNGEIPEEPSKETLKEESDETPGESKSQKVYPQNSFLGCFDIVLATCTRTAPNEPGNMMQETLILFNVDTPAPVIKVSQEYLERLFNPATEVSVVLISSSARGILKMTTRGFLELIMNSRVTDEQRQETYAQLLQVQQESTANQLHYSIHLKVKGDTLRSAFERLNDTEISVPSSREDLLEQWNFGVVWHPQWIHRRYLDFMQLESRERVAGLPATSMATSMINEGLVINSRAPLMGYPNTSMPNPPPQSRALLLQARPFSPILGSTPVEQLEAHKKVMQSFLADFVAFLGNHQPFTPYDPIGPDVGVHVYEFDLGDVLLAIVDIRWWQRYDRFHFSKTVAARLNGKSLRIFFADPYYPGEEEDLALRGPRSLPKAGKEKNPIIDHCNFLEVTPLFARLLYEYLDSELGYAKATKIIELPGADQVLKSPNAGSDFWIYCPYIEVLVNRPTDYTFIDELWKQVKPERWICTHPGNTYKFERSTLEIASKSN